MNNPYVVALVCIGLVACGNSANGQQPAPADTQNVASADAEATPSSPKPQSGPKWVTGQSPMKTSIGELTWTSSYDEVKPCLLINGKAALGQDDISCQNVDIAVLDYGNAITVVGVSNSGGASSLPYYNIVHVDQSHAPTSTIEFGAPDDGYEPNWKQQGDTFASDAFNQDGKQQTAQLLPSGVQLVAKSISKNESAPSELCDSMKDALSSACPEAADCNDITGGLSNLDGSWFRAAESDPRFNYGEFMTACKAVCNGGPVKQDDFQASYCKAQ